MSQSKDAAHTFVEWLESHHGDRGMMADLRHGFVPDRAHRAWPYIARWCGKRFADDDERTVHLTVAAAFSTHPEPGGRGGLGSVMRLIAVGQGSQKGLESFEGRFRRLLTCESIAEICQRSGGVVRAAKQKGVSVDYRQLLRDLRTFRWPDSRERTKVRWASEFWGGGASTDSEEAT